MAGRTIIRANTLALTHTGLSLPLPLSVSDPVFDPVSDTVSFSAPVFALGLCVRACALVFVSVG